MHRSGMHCHCFCVLLFTLLVVFLAAKWSNKLSGAYGFRRLRLEGKIRHAFSVCFLLFSFSCVFTCIPFVIFSRGLVFSLLRSYIESSHLPLFTFEKRCFPLSFCIYLYFLSGDIASYTCKLLRLAFASRGRLQLGRIDSATDRRKVVEYIGCNQCIVTCAVRAKA